MLARLERSTDPGESVRATSFSLVWNLDLCGVAVIVLQQPTEPFPTPNWAFTLEAWGWHRHQDDIPFALVWAFGVIMRHIFFQGMA